MIFLVVLEIGNRKPSGPNLGIPPRKLVNLKGIQDGVKRFAFLLEASWPGSFPDSALIAALLDLKSPVLARAALILECTYYVHRCNNSKCIPNTIQKIAICLQLLIDRLFKLLRGNAKQFLSFQ